jgi:hypothetical protein
MWLIDPKSKHSSVNKVQSVQLVYTKFGLPADAAALMTWLVDPRSKQSSVNKVQSVQFVYTEFGLPADAAALMTWLVDPRSKHSSVNKVQSVRFVYRVWITCRRSCFDDVAGRPQEQALCRSQPQSCR